MAKREPTAKDIELITLHASQGATQTVLFGLLGINKQIWLAEEWTQAREVFRRAKMQIRNIKKRAYNCVLHRVSARAIKGEKLEKWEIELLERSVNKDEERRLNLRKLKEREKSDKLAQDKLKLEIKLLDMQISKFQSELDASRSSGFVAVVEDVATDQLVAMERKFLRGCNA